MGQKTCGQVGGNQLVCWHITAETLRHYAILPAMTAWRAWLGHSNIIFLILVSMQVSVSFSESFYPHHCTFLILYPVILIIYPLPSPCYSFLSAAKSNPIFCLAASWMDGWKDGWMEGCMDGRMDGVISTYLQEVVVLNCLKKSLPSFQAQTQNFNHL